MPRNSLDGLNRNFGQGYVRTLRAKQLGYFYSLREAGETSGVPPYNVRCPKLLVNMCVVRACASEYVRGACASEYVRGACASEYVRSVCASEYVRGACVLEYLRGVDVSE
jgi:hypothetical protein